MNLIEIKPKIFFAIDYFTDLARVDEQKKRKEKVSDRLNG